MYVLTIITHYPKYLIGGSKGAMRDACPPGHLNSFDFMQFLAKFAKSCVHPKHRVAAPCFDYLPKMSPVVKVLSKTVKN